STRPVWLPISISSSTATMAQPITCTRFGKLPCHPHSADGSSAGLTLDLVSSSCPATGAPPASTARRAGAFRPNDRTPGAGGVPGVGQNEAVTTHGEDGRRSVLVLGSTG